MTKLQFLQLSRLSPLSYGALLSGGRWTHHGRELRKLTLAESRDNWHWLGFPPCIPTKAEPNEPTQWQQEQQGSGSHWHFHLLSTCRFPFGRKPKAENWSPKCEKRMLKLNALWQLDQVPVASFTHFPQFPPWIFQISWPRNGGNAMPANV